MNIRTGILLLAVLSLAGCFPYKHRGPPEPVPLELVEAWILDTPGPLEPSGLTRSNGVFFTVADKDDRTIYRVEFGPGTASLVPHLSFTPPGAYRMDWEGITTDPMGHFYLISEEWGRVLQVRPDGACQWVTPDLMRPASENGLFAKPNAGFEGVVWLGLNHWLGLVEREPRGWVEYQQKGNEIEIRNGLMEHSIFSAHLPLMRLPDWSGIDSDGDSLYALFRGAHLVVRLTRNEVVLHGNDGAEVRQTLSEDFAWDYRHIETDPRWAYISQTYGKAEGLVVEGRDVYLIFDNNLGGRQADPGDGRPLLVHARMPAGN